MKTPVQEFVFNCISEAISKNMNPTKIIMHSSVYRSMATDGEQVFNTLYGLDVEIDDSAPNDKFYIL